jgi:hypothetical protein
MLGLQPLQIGWPAGPACCLGEAGQVQTSSLPLHIHNTLEIQQEFCSTGKLQDRVERDVPSQTRITANYCKL